MHIHTTHTRDAALRELTRINRWLIAGSVLLAGALTDVAAHAFPGRKVKQSSTLKTKSARGDAKAGASHASASPSSSSSHALQPPAQAPSAVNEASSSAREPTPTQESVPAQESAPEQESVPAREPAPSQESAPVHESAPEPEVAQEPAPVVSGGS
jgi:hypothetical protein